MAHITSNRRGKPFIAAYVRIAEDLRSRIHEGSLLPGTMLPGMRRHAEEYGVAIGTVQQAVAILVEEGLLRSDGWRGTFVSGPPARGRVATGKIDAPVGHVGDWRPGQLRGNIGIIAAIPHDVTLESQLAPDRWQLIILHAFELALAVEPQITGRFVNLIRADNTERHANDAAQSLLSDGIDALALIRWAETGDDEQIVEIARQIPVVVATASNPPHDVPFVTHDNRAAGYDAAYHAMAAGYRQLFFLAPMPLDMHWQEDRLDGAQKAVLDANLPANALTVYRGNDKRNCSLAHLQPQLGFDLGKAILAEYDLSNAAVLVANDNIAYGFRRAALASGFVPGVHYGLIAFDDRPPSREIGLTTLAPPLHSIGSHAAQMLMRSLQGDSSTSQVWLRSHLISRTSIRHDTGDPAVETERKN